MISIVLADDHHLVRQGLRALLAAEPDFVIVGEAGEGVETTLLTERLQPDVLIVDMAMPGLNGAEVARQVNKRSPRTRVIMLSMHDSEPYVREALRAGAVAYVLKDSTAQDLANAVRSAVAGRRYLSPRIAEQFIDAYLEQLVATPQDPLDTLTLREREVFLLVAQGRSSSEIAQQLFISRRTVETHRTNVMRKLGVKNKAELVRYAVQRGLLPGESG
ncbi:MAG: response regulator transcription factor [Chloroflexi bacterium]|nr:response regulator transcription factor [Chloroflexota bacterium]